MATATLAERLAAVRERMGEQWDKLYDEVVKHLTESDAVSGALKDGDVFPDFQLASADGRFVRLADLLKNGPAVISFYRGRWCAYCSAELAALSEIAPQLREAGATVVAVTPESGGTALRTKIDRDLDLDILCDLDNVLAMECGLVFPVPDSLRKAYMNIGRDFCMIYGNDAWMLPAPATYIVRRDGTIAHAYVNADFRQRMEPAEIVETVKRLQA